MITLVFLWRFVMLSICVACTFVIQCAYANEDTVIAKPDNKVRVLENLILITTLDGTIYGTSLSTGAIKWQFKDGPLLRMSSVIPKKGPMFLPDPTDGTLYAFGGPTADFERLKKLPYSIQELTAESPLRGDDGVLYTGKKLDKWYGIDLETGSRSTTLNVDGSTECPKLDESAGNLVWIGLTEYTMATYDGATGVPLWNVSYVEYKSNVWRPGGVDPPTLYASTSSGLTVAVDTERVVWANELHPESPVVGAYLLGPPRGVTHLQRVPFKSVRSHRLLGLSEGDPLPQWMSGAPPLLQTLYVAQQPPLLFAMSAFVDQSETSIIPQDSSTPRISGPSDISESAPMRGVEESQVAVMSQCARKRTPRSCRAQHILLLGYHDLPPAVPTSAMIALLGNRTVATQPLPGDQPAPLNVSATPQIASPPGTLRDNIATSSLVIIISGISGGLVAFLFLILNKRLLNKQLSPANVSDYSLLSSNSSSSYDGSYSASSGAITIGKIGFFPDSILGRGCEGTCVYRGLFEERPVAVKRLLPECFQLADREVALLRESDAHPNVVRYYATETDRQFRYIALELCDATLQDYVEDPSYSGPRVSDASSLLRGATTGLRHLHHLGIIHRDIKPQNVLLISRRGSSEPITAVISDFGLCRKLSVGRGSVTRSGGIAGTSGWIAPEVLNTSSTTRSVDIFSAGCVYYYVLSDGHHPFGDPIHRQTNIVDGTYSVSRCAPTAGDLIEWMVRRRGRPSAHAVLLHPFHWSPEKQTQFLMDVSDRVEKETMDSCGFLRDLECETIIGGNWVDRVTPDLQADLRRYRTYRAERIAHLLRAIRNKKHHYKDLPDELKLSLGDTASSFIHYFTSRFPLLITHTYKVCYSIRHENRFQSYYSSQESTDDPRR